MFRGALEISLETLDAVPNKGLVSLGRDSVQNLDEVLNDYMGVIIWIAKRVVPDWREHIRLYRSVSEVSPRDCVEVVVHYVEGYMYD